MYNREIMPDYSDEVLTKRNHDSATDYEAQDKDITAYFTNMTLKQDYKAEGYPKKYTWQQYTTIMAHADRLTRLVFTIMETMRDYVSYLQAYSNADDDGESWTKKWSLQESKRCKVDLLDYEALYPKAYEAASKRFPSWNEEQDANEIPF